MIGFSETNELSEEIPRHAKEHQTTYWLDQSTLDNRELSDAIDRIMKRGHEDVILSDNNLTSDTPLDIDFDSMPNFLDIPTSTTTTDFTQPVNIYEMTPTTCTTYPLNNSQSTTTSAYSSLGISPKFTTLSINQHQYSFSPPPQESNNSSTIHQPFVQSLKPTNSKNNLHPPPYVEQQQQNNSILGTSYPFEFQINNSSSDVKRFRSASMNEGPTQQQQQQHTKFDSNLFEQSRLKPFGYNNSPYYHNRTLSSTNTTTTSTSSISSISTDVSSNSAWPFVGCPRPASNSFSEVLNQQQQQLRMNNNLSASYGGSSSFYSLQHQRSPTGFLTDINFQPQQTTNCTLFSLNQSTDGNRSSSPPSATILARKRPSLVDFPVEEIKDDRSSPSCTIEQQSEQDLWSDIEQNSSDPIRDNDIVDEDITSNDDTTMASAGFNSNSTTTKPLQLHPNSSSLFWQYNVQAKGPKTKRILYLKERDPHLFREFSDPVYQIKLTQTKGQTSTKLRKGDGNDVTPNPMKLFQLGKQIQDLSSVVGKSNSSAASVYSGIYQTDQPNNNNNNDTSEVKKEKNKIASRACRLRKKAQHEANKLKLHGLNEEHRQLIELIQSIKLLILKRCHDGQPISPSSSPNESFETAMDQLIATKYHNPVAGNTDGFVQSIISDMELLRASKQQRSHSLNT